MSLANMTKEAKEHADPLMTKETGQHAILSPGWTSTGATDFLGSTSTRPNHRAPSPRAPSHPSGTTSAGAASTTPSKIVAEAVTFGLTSTEVHHVGAVVRYYNSQGEDSHPCVAIVGTDESCSNMSSLEIPSKKFMAAVPSKNLPGDVDAMLNAKRNPLFCHSVAAINHPDGDTTIMVTEVTSEDANTPTRGYVRPLPSPIDDGGSLAQPGFRTSRPYRVQSTSEED